MAERIRKDFQGILTKYAEAFVLNDELKKALFREELEKFRETNGLQLKNIGLKEKIDQLTREIGAVEEKNKKSKAKFDGRSWDWRELWKERGKTVYSSSTK